MRLLTKTRRFGRGNMGRRIVLHWMVSGSVLLCTKVHMEPPKPLAWRLGHRKMLFQHHRSLRFHATLWKMIMVSEPEHPVAWSDRQMVFQPAGRQPGPKRVRRKLFVRGAKSRLERTEPWRSSRVTRPRL